MSQLREVILDSGREMSELLLNRQQLLTIQYEQSGLSVHRPRLKGSWLNRFPTVPPPIPRVLKGHFNFMGWLKLERKPLEKS